MEYEKKFHQSIVQKFTKNIQGHIGGFPIIASLPKNGLYSNFTLEKIYILQAFSQGRHGLDSWDWKNLPVITLTVSFGIHHRETFLSPPNTLIGLIILSQALNYLYSNLWKGHNYLKCSYHLYRWNLFHWFLCGALMENLLVPRQPILKGRPIKWRKANDPLFFRWIVSLKGLTHKD